MKNLLLVLFCCCAFFSCKNEVQKPSQTVEFTESEEPIVEKKESVPFDPSKIIGSYVGDFEFVETAEQKFKEGGSWVNKITIFIDTVVFNKDGLGIVKGHSVVAGNNRPFSGSVNKELECCYYFDVKEPGNDKYDGLFQISYSKYNDELNGSWHAFDKTLNVTQRKFNLERRSFVYDKNRPLLLEKDADLLTIMGLYKTGKVANGILEEEFLTRDILKVNASNTLLKKEDIENMYKGDLEVIRNSIYARHGYSFKNRRMRYFFDECIDWYMPVSTDIRDQLTDLEKKNIELLKRYENHAEAYYDTFSR